MRDGQASVTAQRVAAHRLHFARVPATFGDPAADERLARDVAGETVVNSGSGMVRYLEARTAFFDRLTVGAIGRGVTQIVVAAAGYDGRALRYAGGGVRWFELDHPDTQADKRERLDRLGIDTPHVTFVAADFAVDDIASRLVESGCDREAQTLVLCEGVAVYLTLEVFTAMLAGLRGAVGPASVLGISMGTALTDPLAAERRAAFRQAVDAVGEPARLSVTRAEADELLHAAGWSVQPASDEMARTRAEAAGFVVAVAR
jgi:methyltransferase (TIGR00027 family)